MHANPKPGVAVGRDHLSHRHQRQGPHGDKHVVYRPFADKSGPEHRATADPGLEHHILAYHRSTTHTSLPLPPPNPRPNRKSKRAAHHYRTPHTDRHPREHTPSEGTARRVHPQIARRGVP